MKLVLEDTIKVVVDCNMEWQNNVDVGMFELMHKSSIKVLKETHTVGLDLVCQGKTIRVEKK